MSFLKKEIELYKNLFGKYKLNIESLKRAPGGKALEVGDVFAIYGDILVYGVVIEKNGDLAECVLLSQDVFLSSSKALKIKVNHLVDYVYVTHVNFYIEDNFAKNYCQVIINVKEDINKIAENVEELEEQIYTGPRKEYFDLLIDQISLLYDIFFVKIFNETKDEDKIIEINIPYASEFALVAGTNSLRGENFVGIVEDNTLKVYLQDNAIGKKGKLIFKNQVIYEGELPNAFVSKKIKVSVEDLRKFLVIEVID